MGHDGLRITVIAERDEDFACLLKFSVTDEIPALAVKRFKRKATALSVTPYMTAQTIQPSDKGDYNYFTQVSVAAIAVVETDNAAGGKTVTIGTAAPAA